MNKINEEIDQMAEKMEKSMKSELEVLIDTIKTQGPEGIRKALPFLDEDQKIILNKALEAIKKAKATKMDDNYATPKTTIKITDVKVDEENKDDDTDEKLVKEENKSVDHQGDSTPEGKDSNIVKSDDDMDEDDLEKGRGPDKKPRKRRGSGQSDDEYLKQRSEEYKELERRSEERQKRYSQEAKEKYGDKIPTKSKLKSMSVDELFNMSQATEGPLKEIYDTARVIKQGKNAIVPMKKEQRKEWENRLDTLLAENMKKSEKEEPEIETPAKEMVKEHEKLVEVLESDDKEDDKKEAKKQKKELKEYKEVAKEGDKEEDLEKKAPKGVDPAKHERCVRDVKAQGKDVGSAHAICTASMKKSVQWNDENLLSLGKNGRNFHISVNGYYDELIKKSQEKVEEKSEVIKKSESEMTASELIENGLDKSIEDMKREEIKKAEKTRSYAPTNFSLEDMISACGLTQDQVKDILKD